MKVEEKLKEYILMNYKSIREFVSVVDLPYTTVDGILKRGIHKASVENIIKICKTLNISADELANNRIVPVQNNANNHDLGEMLLFVKTNRTTAIFTLDALPLTEQELDDFIDGADLLLDLIRRKRER